MDVAVAEFVAHTGSDPGLARDILENAKWDLHAAYNIFNSLQPLEQSRNGFLAKIPTSTERDDGDDIDEESYTFPLNSTKDSVKEDEEERDPSEDEDAPPSPREDRRCIDCIKSDNLVNLKAKSVKDWITSDCPHIEAFHPGNLITPPSSYNGSYCDEVFRIHRQHQQQQRRSPSSGTARPSRTSSSPRPIFDPRYLQPTFEGEEGEEEERRGTTETSPAPTSKPRQRRNGSEGEEGSRRLAVPPVEARQKAASGPGNINNPFDPNVKGQAAGISGAASAQSSIRNKCGSAPSVVEPAMTDATVLGSSRLDDAGFESPASDSDAERAAPVVEQLNGTLTRKFARGISAIADNRPLVFQARFQVMRDIQEDEASNSQYFVETPHYSFMLPDLRRYAVDFQEFLRKDLVETSTLVSLENAGRLNWWVDKGAGQTLLPLATSGDGNCLLHAASLGMWGFHDRLLTLRKALHHTLTASSAKGALWRRWRWHQTLQNKQVSLVYSDAIWEEEWNSLVKLSSTIPRSKPESSGSSAKQGTSPKLVGGGGSTAASLPSSESASKAATSPNDRKPEDVRVSADPDGGSSASVKPKEPDPTFYESLEEFHVFVLAHVLRRPIVVVADTMLKDSHGEPFQPIHFGGVYLPLECDPISCKRSPLVLAYDAAHFSAVVAMEGHPPCDPDDPKRRLLPVVVPIVAPDMSLLPLHFAVDPGVDFDWEKETKNPKIAKRLALTTRDKLDMLLKYLDIVKIPFPKTATKNGTLKKGNSATPKQVEPGENQKKFWIWGNDDKSAYGEVEFDSSDQSTKSIDNDVVDSGSPRLAPAPTPEPHPNPQPCPTPPPESHPLSPAELPPPHPLTSPSSSMSSASSSSSHRSKIARGFGSIGRSVSKRLKRNFGFASKKSTVISTTTPSGVDIAAEAVTGQRVDGGINGLSASSENILKYAAVPDEEATTESGLAARLSDVSVTTSSGAESVSPRRHRRFLSSDEGRSDGNVAVGADEKSKTLPKSLPASRRYGVTLRNPFSTLERQKNKERLAPSSSVSTLTTQMVGDPNNLLAAKFCANKRHEYQNEMLQNYLQNVKARFAEERKSKGTEETDSKKGSTMMSPRHGSNAEVAVDGGTSTRNQSETETVVDARKVTASRLPCVSTGCAHYGTPLSSYLCDHCFAKHKEEAVNVEGDIRRLNSPVKKQPVLAAAGRSRAPQRAASSNSLTASTSSTAKLDHATSHSLPRK